MPSKGSLRLRRLLKWAAAAAVAAAPLCGELRVATFRADATPPNGEPLIWLTPAAKVEDPLWAKGLVLADGNRRYVLCTVDWCGIGSSIHELFRRKIGAAANTDVTNVAVHVVHQHTAPYVDGDSNEILSRLGRPAGLMTGRYLEELTDRIARAAAEATRRLEPFDSAGISESAVDRVASARRLFGHDGKVITRFSGGGKDPKLAALPEGPIDPKLRTITLARRGKPLARIHFYATHPQTFCCDGRVTGDFAGAAREAMEREEGVFQIYFTGCSGDVTVGKYNDGTPESREQLAARLKQGMAASASATRFSPAGKLRWRHGELVLTPKPAEAARAVLQEAASHSGEQLYRAALVAAFADRKRPLEVNLLEIGKAAALFLPGEPMLEFQNYAVRQAAGRFLAVAGYGDIQPGYLCTDQAFREGGYEPSASNAGPGTEKRLKAAIRSLLIE